MINGAAIRLVSQISKVLLYHMFKQSPCLNGEKNQIDQLPQNISRTMIKIEHYNCITQTASSAFKVMSRDRVSDITFKIHMFMLSWDPTLGFM